MASPILQSIILAEHVYTDAERKCKVIAGTFNYLTVPEGAEKFDRATFAYLCLTEVSSEPTDLVLKYVDLLANEVLMKSPTIQISADSPLDSVECLIQVPPFPIPHEGAYAFEAHCDGAILGAVRLTAKIHGKGEQQ